tara:strand:+ start:46 stop:360 length:315 start_codon:yes stop_codon:yes gene_type:complete
MKEITPLITPKTQKQLTTNCLVQIDRSEFEGQTYSSAPFFKEFDTEQYLFEVFGTVDITWRNKEEYDFNKVSSISITMHDDNGEVFPDDKMYDVIQNQLQFSII